MAPFWHDLCVFRRLGAEYQDVMEHAQMSSAIYVQVYCLQGTLAGKLAAFLDPGPLPLPQPFLFGRGDDCHLCFQGPANGMVSRRHAELRRSEQGLVLVDRSSQGLYLAPSQKRVFELNLERGTTALLQFGPGGPSCAIATGITIPLGHYRLVAKLGEGGMAEVYLASDTRLARLVVLKLLRPALRQQDPLAGKHLLKEARTVAPLEHNHVVRIYEVGELDGIPYIAMEYLRGITLRELNEQLAALGQRLPPSLAAAIVRQACLGLHAAHELPSMVVHRDVSPNNILITRESVKVIDFGIARTSGASGLPVTETQATKGCPPYMSPEQICDPQNITRRSDIFSMAVVLYELCSGQSLFCRSQHIATLAAVLTEDPAPLRSVCEQASERLELLLENALCKRPDERTPQTAAEFADALKKEAGEHLLHHENLIKALEQLGIRLHGTPPCVLSREPELLRGTRWEAPEPGLLRAPTQPLSPPGSQPLVPVALPEAGGRFEVRTASLPRLVVTSQELDPREYREPVPLALELDGIACDCRQPLVLALANRLLELRVAPETVRAGRLFRIYPSELSTEGARNSYALPLPCPAKPLHVGHHRGPYRLLTVASCGTEAAQAPPLRLELPELGVKLLAPPSADRLFVAYRIEPQHAHGYLSCFTVK